MQGWLGRLAYSGVLRCSGSRTVTGKWLHAICNKMRYRLIRHGDPVVTMPIDGRRLRMHLSHQLPLYWSMHPLYDRAVPRIARYVADAAGAVEILDVGANIGDTASALLTDPRARVVCVEADEKYFPLLLANTANAGDRVRCVFACCHDAEGNGAGGPVRSGGTTRFSAGVPHASTVQTRTLDAIIQNEAPGFSPDLLKIDTDGYDFKVLRGSENLLRSAKPAIFFEWQPEFLESQGDDPLSIFPWLAERGYGDLLLYDNLGHSVGILDTSDRSALKSALAHIDGRTVHYYDILAVHRDAHSYIRSLLPAEMAAASRPRLSCTTGPAT
jgi:FkbM family methyltransferase